MTGLSNNPYAPPTASVTDPDAGSGSLIPGGRTVPAGSGLNWIAGGWNLFKQAPGPWIGMFVIFVVVWLVLSVIPLINFFTVLVFPVFMGGFMIAANNQRETGSLNIGDLFAGFQQKAGPLIILGLLTLAFTIVAMIPSGVVAVVGGLTALGSGSLSNMGTMLGAFGIAIVLAVALISLVYAAVWFAPALIVLHDMPPFEAMKTSFFACFRNWTAGLLYFLLVTLVLVIAIIPFGVGMLVARPEMYVLIVVVAMFAFFLGSLVAGPVMYASIYAAYRDIFIEE